MQAWTVFKQDSANKPHQMVGSVHAGDGETALLSARNVYGRRPKAVSMWVAPVDRSLTWTHEDVARHADLGIDLAHDVDSDDVEKRWQVFRKTGQRRAMTFVDHIGEVKSATAEGAMRRAIAIYSDNKQTWVWMVVPERQIKRSASNDAASWFDPALDKTYKQQSAYGLMDVTRKQRTQTAKARQEGAS